MVSDKIVSMAKKPHAICVPFPAQGHINPMLQVAKLLYFKGFHITFVNTEYIHNRILKSNPKSLHDHPHFRFVAINNGLDPLDHEANLDVGTVCYALSNNCPAPFLDLINKLNTHDTENSSEIPPVSCIVSDGGMTFTIDTADQLGIPHVLFWTSSGCGVLGYVHYRHLVERGLAPLKDASCLTNGYLETTIDWIPGMKNIRLKDLPTFFRTTDPNDLHFNWILREVDRASRASAIIMNTFDSLEPHVLNSLRKMYPRLYTIGPLQLFVDDIIKDNTELKKMDPSLWKKEEEQETECIKWLDSKEPNSVLFVNFGSTTVMNSQQLIELAWGLANSKKQFLWVLRCDHVQGGDLGILPAELVADTKNRGFLMGWCPSQENILKHPSIAGFLSHMGWNSTLESVCGGVPMICWPNFADQTTVCMYACSEWGIGIELDKNVKRYEVEKVVRELFEGEKGREMKKKAMEWKRKGEEATSPGGSSYHNLEKFLEILLGNKKKVN